MSTPRPTQSHLLNRLLQRQISQLESENATLKVRVAKLESRVTDSTAKHRAINGTAADDIARANIECQTISRETERTAKLMVQHLRHSQNRLLEVTQDLHHEQKRLAHAIGEFYSTLDTLPSHAQRDAAALVRTAHARQESLLAQLAELYDSNGLLRHSETQTRLNARQVEEQATAHRRQITTAIEREQNRHAARLTHAQDQARVLVQLLATTSESITKLQAAIQSESHAVVPATPSAAKTVRPTPVSLANVTPHHEERVLETARRGIAEEATPAPSPVLKPFAPVIRAPYDNESYRALPKSGAVIIPTKSRPFLQIGITLAAFVIVVLVISMMM
jgi:hypothetical protein